MDNPNKDLRIAIIGGGNRTHVDNSASDLIDVPQVWVASLAP